MKICTKISKKLLVAMAIACAMGLVATEQKASKAESKSDTIAVSDVGAILGYAEAELENASTFGTGIDDISLVVAQPEVVKALQTNNKASTQVKKLKINSRIAALLKKAFKATRKADAPGYEYREEVARLLVTVYGLWSNEDALQKLNFEKWSDQIFDELGHKKKALVKEIEQEKAAIKPEPKLAEEPNRAPKKDLEGDDLTRLPEGVNSARELREKGGQKKLRQRQVVGGAQVEPRKKPRRPAAPGAPRPTSVQASAVVEHSAAAQARVKERKKPGTGASSRPASTPAWQQARPNSERAARRKAKAPKLKKVDEQGAHHLDRRKPEKAQPGAANARRARDGKAPAKMARENQKATVPSNSSSVGSQR